MKILFCTNSLGAKGGIEKVTIIKANAFVDIECNEVAVCFTDKGTYPDDMIHNLSPEVHVFDLGVPFWDLYPLNFKNLLIAAPKKFWQLRKSLKKVILDFQPDIVISTGSYEKYALATIRPVSLLGKQCVKVREYHFNSNYRDYLQHKSRVSNFAANLEYNVLAQMFDMNYLLTKEDLLTNFKGRKRFDFQYNPVTFHQTLYIPINNRDKAVIAVCRLTDQKNVHAIIRVWAAIKSGIDGWVLRIVGEGEQRQELEDLAARLGVINTIDFLGFRKDIPELLCRSRILAMTSKYEGFGINIVEAMACGTVPIAYRTPYGPNDIITDGRDGVLVDYLNERQFASSLKSLILSPRKLDNMSKAAVVRSRDFSTERITKQWMKKYQALLSEMSKNNVVK